MWHVAEGTLHAYLDALERPAGDALAAEERAAVETHLAACSACAAALEQERRIRARAGAVLDAAAPPLLELPALQPARPRRRVPLVRLAWAASLVAAVGAGWLGSGLWRSGALDSPSPAQFRSTTSGAPVTEPAGPQAELQAGASVAPAAGLEAAGDARAESSSPGGAAGTGGAQPALADAAAAQTQVTPERAALPQAEAPRPQAPLARAEPAPGPPAPVAEAIIPTGQPAVAPALPLPAQAVEAVGAAPREAVAKAGEAGRDAAARRRGEVWPPPGALALDARIEQAPAAAAVQRYPGDDDVAWAPITVDVAVRVLGGGLFVLAGAPVDSVQLAADGARVRVHQRSEGGAVELVQWRTASPPRVAVPTPRLAADSAEYVVVQRDGVQLALKAARGARVLPLLLRLERRPR